MSRLWPDDDPLEDLLARLDPKFRPVWEGRSPADRLALARYFLPARSTKDVISPTRPRVIKWYCPFACQHVFPSGHRYCINVYAGCAHRCIYCYAAAYEPDACAAKKDFTRLIDKDMADLERFNVPAAPVHLSNSTDAFQPADLTTGHTRYALEQILAHRNRFTTVTVITKNPSLAATPVYRSILQKLCCLAPDHPGQVDSDKSRQGGLVVEVSLAFWRDEARQFYEPCAPSIAERIEGLRVLRDAGIPLVLRIDPLFPRSPLPEARGRSLGDFGLPEAQTEEDLEALVDLAARLDVRHVVFSVAKLVRPRFGGLSPAMQSMRYVYAACTVPASIPFRSGSWRFPQELANQHIVGPFLELCRRRGVSVRHCMQNLLGGTAFNKCRQNA